jgi:hypothetical protein
MSAAILDLPESTSFLETMSSNQRWPLKSQVLRFGSHLVPGPAMEPATVAEGRHQLHHLQYPHDL